MLAGIFRCPGINLLPHPEQSKRQHDEDDELDDHRSGISPLT